MIKRRSTLKYYFSVEGEGEIIGDANINANLYICRPL